MPVFWSTAWIVIVCPGKSRVSRRVTGFEDSAAVRLDGLVNMPVGLEGLGPHARRGKQATRVNRARTLGPFVDSFPHGGLGGVSSDVDEAHLSLNFKRSQARQSRKSAPDEQIFKVTQNIEPNLGRVVYSHNFYFIFELLVPATHAQMDVVEGDQHLYDRDLRPSLMVAALDQPGSQPLGMRGS